MKKSILLSSALKGIMLILLCCWAISITHAQTQPCPLADKCFPPLTGKYNGGPTFQLYPSQGNTSLINFNDVMISQFTNCGFPVIETGRLTVITFDAQVNGNIFGLPIPPNFNALARASLTIDMTGQVLPSEFFDTEMLQLNISGGTLPPAVLIRESPTKQSLGKAVITESGGGFIINSFFDIFTELSLDGGQSWMPALQSGRLTLTTPVPDCNDDNPCTEDFLDANCVCHHVNHTPTTCDDNNPCTDDFLNANCQCSHINHQPTTCDDKDPCTVDFLDANCVCQHINHRPESCDDGNPCTDDFLDAECICRHVTVSCDDGDPCTKDFLDPNCGCHHDPVCPVSTDPCIEIVCEEGVCVPRDLRPIVTVSSNSSVCVGNTLNLYSNVSGGGCISYNFQWNGPNGFNSTDKNPSIPAATTAASGPYTLTVSCVESNCVTTVTTEVFVVPCAVVCQYVRNSQPPACTGECPQFYYKDGTEAGKADCEVTKKEKVNKRGQVIERGVCSCNNKLVLYTNTCTATANGKDCKGDCTPIYRSKGDAENDRNRINGHCRPVNTAAANTCGCVYDIKPKRLSGDSQTNEIETSGFLEMYPNPASQEINIVVEDFEGKTVLNVINVLGEQVISRDVQLKGEPLYSIDVNTLAPGIYKIVLMNNNQLSSGTFIKE